MSIVSDPSRPLAVDSFAIRRHVDWPLALRAAEVAATQRAEGAVDDRRVTLPFDGGWIRVMVAALPAMNLVGYKEFHLTNAGTVRYAVHLFALDSGAPLGVVDAALVTTLRTAASAALASRWFFGEQAEVALGVVGSGAEALAGVQALAAVLNVTSVRVTSRRRENCERFARELEASLGARVQVVDGPAQALADATMAYVATNSGGQVVLEWDQLSALPFVASIGSTLPAQRELGDTVLAKADTVVVDTWDVLEDSGDALAAAQVGLDPSRYLLLGEMPGRAWDPNMGRTVYKSIGSPEQDLVLAASIVDLAAAKGFGRGLHPLSDVKKNL